MGSYKIGGEFKMSKKCKFNCADFNQMISKTAREKLLVPFLIFIQVVILLAGGFVYYFLENATEVQISNGSSNLTDTKEISYTDSVFFIMTAVTTIGYGHEAPKSRNGKMFTVIATFIGVPFNLMLVAAIGSLFKQIIFLLLRKIRRRVKNKRYFVLIQACVALPLGKLLLVFLPAVVFMKVEDWSYLDAFYFTFITIYTVGFGDYVATIGTKIENQHLYILYRICFYIWIYVGMAYIALMINLAVDYLSVKVENMEKEIAELFVEKIISSHQYYLSSNSNRGSSKAIQQIIPEEDNKKVYLGRYLSRTDEIYNLYDELELKSHAVRLGDKPLERDDEASTSDESNDNTIKINCNSESILLETSKQLANRVPSLRPEALKSVISTLRNSMHSMNGMKRKKLHFNESVIT